MLSSSRGVAKFRECELVWRRYYGGGWSEGKREARPTDVIV